MLEIKQKVFWNWFGSWNNNPGGRSLTFHFVRICLCLLHFVYFEHLLTSQFELSLLFKPWQIALSFEVPSHLLSIYSKVRSLSSKTIMYQMTAPTMRSSGYHWYSQVISWWWAGRAGTKSFTEIYFLQIFINFFGGFLFR